MQLYEKDGSRTTLSTRDLDRGVLGLKDGSWWLVRPLDRGRCKRWELEDFVTGRLGKAALGESFGWWQERDYPYVLYNHFKDTFVAAFHLGSELPETLPDSLNPHALPPPPEPVFDPLAGPVDAWYTEKRLAEIEAKEADIKALHGPGFYIFGDDGSLLTFTPLKDKPKRRRKSTVGKT
jgi:hypothetical protein